MRIGSPDQDVTRERDLNRRNRSEFATTNTDEKAIAAPASIGLSNPKAAKGIIATLYAKAQKRFPLITLKVLRERRKASTAATKSFLTKVISLASIATSDPELIAKPRSA
jgi:hypothetical protein